jgi:hypothetical protein
MKVKQSAIELCNSFIPHVDKFEMTADYIDLHFYEQTGIEGELNTANICIPLGDVYQYNVTYRCMGGTAHLASSINLLARVHCCTRLLSSPPTDS